MNRVYIVWELIPEEVKIYSLMLSDEDLMRAKRCHNQFLNLVDVPEDVQGDLEWLSGLLTDSKKLVVYDSSEESRQEPVSVKEGALIVCGFAL